MAASHVADVLEKVVAVGRDVEDVFVEPGTASA
jgi:hypothetical protein